MLKIAILLHGSIKSDYRVIKTMRSLAKKHEIHLFFCGIDADVLNHFEGFQNIKCFAIKQPKGWKQKFLAHTFFCYEYNFMIKEVLKNIEDYDVIWANDLPTLYPAAQLAKQQNAKLIYDSHEIFVETLNQFFIKGSNPLKNLIFDRLIKIMRRHGKKIEAQFLNTKNTPCVDLMFTVNESLKNYFQENYQFQNIQVLMNLPCTQKFQDQGVFNFRQFFGWSNNSVVVLYQGALNRGRGLELLIDAAVLLPENYKIVILGDGLLRKELLAKTNKLNLDNSIGFMPAVPLESLPNHTKGADIGINLLETYNLSKQLASPNKLFEYIHAEIPVVASDSLENRKVFDCFEIGALCKNSPDDVSDKIQLVIKSNLSFKNNLARAKQTFSWEKQEGHFLQKIEQAISIIT